MRKLFVILVAIFLMASSAYAWVETANNGPQQETVCFITGVGTCTSGNVVVLQTAAAATYPGKEVTFSTTNGDRIYGVVVDTRDFDANDLDSGGFIKVQTYGFNNNMLIAGDSAIAVGNGIGTSTTRGRATLGAATAVTFHTVAQEAGVGTVPASAGQQLSVIIEQ